MAQYTIGGAWRFAYALSGGQSQFPTLTQNVNFTWNADRFTAIKLSGYKMTWTRAATGADVVMFDSVWQYASGYTLDTIFDDGQTVDGDFLWWLVSATSTQGDYTASYTVTFDPNGGAPTPDPIQVEDVLPDLPTDLSRPGYYLAGWSYTRDFLSRAYPGDPIASDTTLYAWWRVRTHVTVYDDSGIYRYYEGDIANPRTVTTTVVGASRTLTIYDDTGTRVITYTAYAPDIGTFAGWSYTQGGDVDIPAISGAVPLAQTDTITLWEIYTDTATIDPTVTMTLYRQTAEPNRVDKRSYMTALSTLTGALRAECDIVNPSITVYDTAVPKYNYAHIPDFGRYYYIDNITSVGRNLWRLDMRADVLMSWRSQIGALQAVVARNEHNYDIALTDNRVVTSATTDVTAISSPASPFDMVSPGVIGSNIILVVQQSKY